MSVFLCAKVSQAPVSGLFPRVFSKFGLVSGFTTHLELAFDEENNPFSKSVLMRDNVIGLLINKVKFGLDIHAKSQG